MGWSGRDHEAPFGGGLPWEGCQSDGEGEQGGILWHCSRPLSTSLSYGSMLKAVLLGRVIPLFQQIRKLRPRARTIAQLQLPPAGQGGSH